MTDKSGRHVPIFFEPGITTIDIMRAAAAIGCIVCGDHQQLIIRRRQPGDRVGARGVIVDPELPINEELV